MKGIEYRGVTSVDGPIVVLKRTENVFYNETVCVRDRLGEKRTGKVVDISDECDDGDVALSTIDLTSLLAEYAPQIDKHGRSSHPHDEISAPLGCT